MLPNPLKGLPLGDIAMCAEETLRLDMHGNQRPRTGLARGLGVTEGRQQPSWHPTHTER